jgi:hypothetical protein
MVDDVNEEIAAADAVGTQCRTDALSAMSPKSDKRNGVPSLPITMETACPRALLP